MRTEENDPHNGAVEEGSTLSAAERRRQRKAEIAAARKAEKAQKPTAEPKSSDHASTSAIEAEEALDPTKYLENRLKLLQHEKDTRRTEIYPHKFQVSVSLSKYIEDYSHLENGEHIEDQIVTVAGRVMRLAVSSKALRFYDLVGDDSKIQIISSAAQHDESCGQYLDVHNAIRRGDVVGVRGFPGKSKRGELSIFACEVKLLSPCLHMLPVGGEYQSLKDQEIRCRRRYLDLLTNKEAKRTFRIRAQVVKHIRDFLEADGFQEVETPMMNLIAGGANARPFITHHNDLNTDFYMRVAPELYLKMLVVGGMEKVFEIGKNFRNEGIDLTHNPEFTSCEFYEAYADVYDLMDKTERMMHSMVQKIHGTSTTTLTIPHAAHGQDCHHHAEGEGKEEQSITIDWSPPFKRISIVEEIERCAQVTLPRPLDSEECITVLKRLVVENHLEMPQPPTAAKLIDKLCGPFIEDKIINPTFVIEHPLVMSPLAKWHRSKPEVAERAELFVAGKEICNLYTELNDPIKQRECFVNQSKARAEGDDEGMQIDEEFCVALEHGLPPTAGWGCGVDRLTMYMANKIAIKEVILFPAMRAAAN